jgi:hypothetical protein
LAGQGPGCAVLEVQELAKDGRRHTEKTDKKIDVAETSYYRLGMATNISLTGDMKLNVSCKHLHRALNARGHY